MAPSARERLADVVRLDGESREIRVLEGHLFVCQGCCCGNVERGFPEIPLEAFKSQWKSRGIRRRVHLTISGCLGPCAVANVIMLVMYGRTVWLHSIDSPRQVSQIYDYVERMLAAEEFLPVEGALAPCEFNRYTTDACAAPSAVVTRSAPHDHETGTPEERLNLSVHTIRTV